MPPATPGPAGPRPRPRPRRRGRGRGAWTRRPAIRARPVPPARRRALTTTGRHRGARPTRPAAGPIDRRTTTTTGRGRATDIMAVRAEEQRPPPATTRARGSRPPRAGPPPPSCGGLDPLGDGFAPGGMGRDGPGTRAHRRRRGGRGGRAGRTGHGRAHGAWEVRARADHHAGVRADRDWTLDYDNDAREKGASIGIAAAGGSAGLTRTADAAQRAQQPNGGSLPRE